MSTRQVEEEEMATSWLEKLEKAKAEALARNAEPWRLPLERLRGKVGDDGVERISTQTIFDVLEATEQPRSRRLQASGEANAGAWLEPDQSERDKPTRTARAN
jgi:hypothetical protein